MQRTSPSQPASSTMASKAPGPDAIAEPMLITAGPMLCRLRVWTDEEWAELAEADRPSTYTHAPGLGWVGAEAIDCMN